MKNVAVSTLPLLTLRSVLGIADESDPSTGGSPDNALVLEAAVSQFVGGDAIFDRVACDGRLHPAPLAVSGPVSFQNDANCGQ